MNYPNNFLSYTNAPPYSRYQNNKPMPLQVNCVEPYFTSALMNLKNTRIVVETIRDSITGILQDVKPDHIIIGEENDKSRFIIRIAEIVHIMPINED